MHGGDIITQKSWYISIIILCVAISGLFYSGVLNDQNEAYMAGTKTMESSSQSNTPQLASEANAESKVKKRDVLSVTAKCSCSLYGDYKLHDPAWVNYCPVCHRYGTLIFEKTCDCPEGMIRCTHCDADFCAVHGKEHVYRHPTYLKHA